MDRIKVMIADDHALVRMGLKLLISTQKDLEYVGDAEDGEQAVAKVAELHPDVAVLDLQMPIMDGTEATEKIRTEHPGTQVIILTSYITADGISHALEKGAIGAILKSETETALVNAIRLAAKGESYITKEIKAQIASDPPVKDLSPRQLEIVSGIIRGLSNEEIGEMLGIERHTVKNHLAVLFKKLGAANRSEAIAIALRKHLVKD